MILGFALLCCLLGKLLLQRVDHLRQLLDLCCLLVYSFVSFLSFLHGCDLGFCYVACRYVLMVDLLLEVLDGCVWWGVCVWTQHAWLSARHLANNTWLSGGLLLMFWELRSGVLVRGSL